MLLCSEKAWIQTKLWPPLRNATSLWDSSGFETGKMPEALSLLATQFQSLSTCTHFLGVFLSPGSSGLQVLAFTHVTPRSLSTTAPAAKSPIKTQFQWVPQVPRRTTSVFGVYHTSFQTLSFTWSFRPKGVSPRLEFYTLSVPEKLRVLPRLSLPWPSKMGKVSGPQREPPTHLTTPRQQLLPSNEPVRKRAERVRTALQQATDDSVWLFQPLEHRSRET